VLSAVDASVLSERFYLKYFRWVVPTGVSGDRCLLKSTAGTVLFDSYADGANYIDIAPYYGWVDGLNLETISKGTLYVVFG